MNGYLSSESDHGTSGGMAQTKHLQRIISIEEDHLPQLLDMPLEKQLSKWTEENDNASPEKEMDEKQIVPSPDYIPSSPRGQPVGKETQSNVREQFTLNGDGGYNVINYFHKPKSFGFAFIDTSSTYTI